MNYTHFLFSSICLASLRLLCSGAGPGGGGVGVGGLVPGAVPGGAQQVVVVDVHGHLPALVGVGRGQVLLGGVVVLLVPQLGLGAGGGVEGLVPGAG